jgi:polysaccharide pyruvyl transferase WcaK-like protein
VKILFGGYYGMKNYGDDLFGLVASKGSSLFWPDIDTALACPPIASVESQYSVPKWVPRNIYSSVGYAGKALRFSFLTRGAIHTDKFIFFGGSLFSSSGSKAFDAIIKNNSRRKCFFSGIGISIGPFNSIKSEKKTIEQLKSFEYLALRDVYSYNLLNSYNIECKCVLSADPVGLMPALGYVKTTINTNKKVKKIGFSPCYLSNNANESKIFCDAFVRSVKTINSKIDIEVEIINLNSHVKLGDYQLCKYVFEELLKLQISCTFTDYSSIGVESTWKVISLLDMYVSMRLHGALTAFINSVPFLLYEYHEKCSNFLDDIGQSADFRIRSASYSCDHLESIIYHLIMEKYTANSNDYCGRSKIGFLKAPWLF